MSDDQIFREVEEDLRREQLKAIWDKFGLYIIGAAFTIVAVVAGQQGWKYWSQQQADQAGQIFAGAQLAASEKKNDEAAKAFEKLIQEGPSGYRILSMFQLAASHSEAGKKDDAVKIYDQIIADGSVDDVLKGFARIHKSFLIVDKADYKDIKDHLGPMAVAGNPWRNSARELIGLSAYGAGHYQEAMNYYRDIISDVESPQSLRERAQEMMSLILGDESGKLEKTAAEKVNGEKVNEPGKSAATQDKAGQNTEAKSGDVDKKSSENAEKPSK